MKKIFFTIVLLVSAYAHACLRNQAEIVGRGFGAKFDKFGICEMRVEIRSVESRHPQCPLRVREGQKVRVRTGLGKAKCLKGEMSLRGTLSNSGGGTYSFTGSIASNVAATQIEENPERTFIHGVIVAGGHDLNTSDGRKRYEDEVRTLSHNYLVNQTMDPALADANMRAALEQLDVIAIHEHAHHFGDLDTNHNLAYWASEMASQDQELPPRQFPSYSAKTPGNCTIGFAFNRIGQITINGKSKSGQRVVFEVGCGAEVKGSLWMQADERGTLSFSTDINGVVVFSENRLVRNNESVIGTATVGSQHWERYNMLTKPRP